MTQHESPAAGWYPVDDGRQRYWDGQRWTDHFHDPAGRTPSHAHTAAHAAKTVAARVVATEVQSPGDTIWAAVGRPLTRVGAGRYRLSAHYLFFETGTLRTDSQQVPISAVVDVDVQQSISQKARNVYTVIVHVQRSRGIEVVRMEDIPEGREAMRIINEAAHSARLAIQRQANTMRYEGQAGYRSEAAAGPARSASSTPAATDGIAQLKQLAELRDAGIVSDQEFAAKKAEILARM